MWIIVIFNLFVVCEILARMHSLAQPKIYKQQLNNQHKAVWQLLFLNLYQLFAPTICLTRYSYLLSTAV